MEEIKKNDIDKRRAKAQKTLFAIRKDAVSLIDTIDIAIKDTYSVNNDEDAIKFDDKIYNKFDALTTLRIVEP